MAEFPSLWSKHTSFLLSTSPTTNSCWLCVRIKNKFQQSVSSLFYVYTAHVTTHKASPMLDNPFKTLMRKYRKNGQEIAHKSEDLETEKQTWIYSSTILRRKMSEDFPHYELTRWVRQELFTQPLKQTSMVRWSNWNICIQRGPLRSLVLWCVPSTTYLLCDFGQSVNLSLLISLSIIFLICKWS